MRTRFGIERFCIVADRGMIRNDTIQELVHQGTRYIVCVNSRQQRKDAATRDAIITALEIELEEEGKHFVLRTECKRHCGKIFQAVGVAIPPSIRAVS